MRALHATRDLAPRLTNLSICVPVAAAVFIHRANIGRDISSSDEDLIVLFRRNSKEVTSEPAHWSAEHCAVWNQHLGIQTSLLRHKKAGNGANEFLKKEYEIVLVAVSPFVHCNSFARVGHMPRAPITTGTCWPECPNLWPATLKWSLLH